MKVYEAIFNEDDSQGVYALSVVENPAMEDFWITLSEQPKEIQLSAVDEEKRLLLGAALIPNKKIYRNVGGNEFYITFTEDTIEKLSHNFQKKGQQNNSNLEHETKLSGMSVVESWIVENPTNDKSNHYGKTYEKGTWVTMMKVDNDEVWAKAKAGEIKGFSIDALLSLQEINFKNDIKMSETVDSKSIIDAIKEGFHTVFNSQKEVEKIEVAPEVVTAPVTDEAKESLDIVEFSKVLNDSLLELKSHFEKQIEGVTVEFSKVKEDLEKENADLKVELSKQPEAKAIQTKGDAKQVEIKLNKEGRFLQALRNAK